MTATWPRYDPRCTLWLCESCSNAGDWQHHCAHGLCECPRCNEEKAPRRKRLVGADGKPLKRLKELEALGQTQIDVPAITIRSDS